MQLFASVPDFNRPIEALYICHENILKRMSMIDTMGREILAEGAAAFSRQIESWREIFSFIEHSIGNHTRDEEEGLFPLLAEHRGTPVENLLADHDEAERTEAWLAERFETLAADEETGTAEGLVEFADRALWLADFYRRHIALENEMVFPEAERTLTEEEKRDLGLKMRRHRNITITIPEGL
jgi:hemerythrin-like domain-containing protein